MLLAYAWKGFWRRRSRAILAVLGTSLAVGLFVGVVSITHAIDEAVGGSLRAAGADVVVQKIVEPCPFAEVKRPKDLGGIDDSVVAQLKATPGVEDVSGVLELWAFHGGHPVVVAGVDPEKKTLGPTRIETKHGEDDKSCCAIIAGRYLVPNDDYHVVVAKPYMDKKKLELGQKIWIGPDRRFEIVGVVDLSGAARIAGAEVFIPLKIAQQMLNEGPVVTTIFVAVTDSKAIPAVEQQARELIGEGAAFASEENVDEGMAALAATTRRSMVAVSLLILLFTVAMLIRSGVESVMERITEVGLMKALGWRNADVGRLFMTEALYTGLFGGAIGCGLGWLISWGYGKTANLKLPENFGSRPACSTTDAPLALNILSTAPPPAIFIGGIVAALVIGMLAGMVAAHRAARLDPVVALRRI